jgi:hypothetical protein
MWADSLLLLLLQCVTAAFVQLDATCQSKHPAVLLMLLLLGDSECQFDFC